MIPCRFFIGRMVLVLAAALLFTGAARAQEAKKPSGGGDEATNLAKQAQNPVAKLISVRFQNNFNFGAGSENAMVWIINVQPVIPVPLPETR